MNVIAQLVAPVYYRWDYDKPFRALYLEWRQARTALEPEFQAENIRFEHDPLWRYRLFSIQSAHDRNHWVWRATGVVWMSLAGAI